MPKNPDSVVQKAFCVRDISRECGFVQTQKCSGKAASSGILMKVVPRAARQLGLSWVPLTFHSEGLFTQHFPACEVLNGRSQPGLAKQNAHPLEGCAKSLQQEGSVLQGGGEEASIPYPSLMQGPNVHGQICLLDTPLPARGTAEGASCVSCRDPALPFQRTHQRTPYTSLS